MHLNEILRLRFSKRERLGIEVLIEFGVKRKYQLPQTSSMSIMTGITKVIILLFNIPNYYISSNQIPHLYQSFCQSAFIISKTLNLKYNFFIYYLNHFTFNSFRKWHRLIIIPWKVRPTSIWESIGSFNSLKICAPISVMNSHKISMSFLLKDSNLNKNKVKLFIN